MSSSLVTVEHNQLVFEAMLQMLRNNMHHLPVLKNHRPIGVIALSDIIQYESRNSLFVVSSIFRQQSADDLAALTGDVRACFARMVTEDASSRMIGSAMAVIGRSFKQRLLELAEETLGPPPVPYCFLALGSMARQEQLIVTDQDNALVLDNSFDPARHDDLLQGAGGLRQRRPGALRLQLLHRRGDGDECEMAPAAASVERYFSEWIEQPTPESLLNSGIFFDIDGCGARPNGSTACGG